MSNNPSFSDKAVQSAISAAQEHYSALRADPKSDKLVGDGHHVSLLSECISVTISNGKACLNLPLGIGHVCIPVPISYDSKVAQACLSTCTTFGIPTGVRVSVSVAGVTVATASYGKC